MEISKSVGFTNDILTCLLNYNTAVLTLEFVKVLLRADTVSP